MQTVERSALVPYSAEQMFTLVADIPRYGEFLGWCDSASIVSRHADVVVAEIAINFKGVRKTFTTRNQNKAPSRIDMELVQGPFRRLDGYWRFEPLGDNGSKIELMLNFDFSNPLLRRMVGPVFTQIASQQIDAFHNRAKEVYG